MQVRQPRYSKDEHARRGTALYEQHVRPQLRDVLRERLGDVAEPSGARERLDLRRDHDDPQRARHVICR